MARSWKARVEIPVPALGIFLFLIVAVQAAVLGIAITVLGARHEANIGELAEAFAGQLNVLDAAVEAQDGILRLYNEADAAKRAELVAEIRKHCEEARRRQERTRAGSCTFGPSVDRVEEHLEALLETETDPRSGAGLFGTGR